MAPKSESARKIGRGAQNGPKNQILEKVHKNFVKSSQKLKKYTKLEGVHKMAPKSESARKIGRGAQNGPKI